VAIVNAKESQLDLNVHDFRL